MKEIGFYDYLIGAATVLPWAIVIWKAYKPKKGWQEVFGIILALVFGWLSTDLILRLHPIFWPEADFSPKKKVSLLTQTAHMAFIQAGITEETFKIFFIMILSFVFGYDRKTKLFSPNVVLFGAFVAMGFSFIENTHYIFREPEEKKWNLFIARTIHSSNIHLLINLCFSLFLLKSNFKADDSSKKVTILFGFVLAVLQHGVVDFLLIPGATIGLWISTAMFVGIWVWVVNDWRELIVSIKEVPIKINQTSEITE
ncbi:PrsW family intramembrane metalloprotease [Leptospira biflexa]|jgi:RsiW-degrading membrane proteinase PrsW (M82 family)|uniref:PrsW family glutamic-type intramembrane protease n=1 Tax=Leptospira biflexa TaxID=172 RepID=UPI001083F2F1|nr:PrsW family glutamic-type intramembrane protease [Leptospira biflexa]TGM38278.1 PrsW family intramembrane metalloprotease [Leptospira biflexa]TGM41611.1 PrsW family intramembrane metalloprotease [Leptospira biflexa]TGM47811.1 PrsW family intramembrane metalloprotease [Leptospira biflexa]TGM49723.1 PrsW family intramembrane metalloprotease [Leptospira biflexa]TGM54984.1 PrsW family intramembrane metalloprotease [Leptospira biflexa]